MAKSTSLRAQNNSGSVIKANKAIYISGVNAVKQIPTIALASNDNEAKMPAVGITIEDIPNGDDGLVRIGGVLVGFNTSSAANNAPIFVGRSGGILYSNPSDTPNTKVVQQIGTVASSAEEPDGQIFLFPLELQRKHAVTHEIGGSDKLIHSDIEGIDEDDHKIYPLVDGSRGFGAPVGGIEPTSGNHLATKNYVDNFHAYASVTLLTDSNAITSEYSPFDDSNHAAFVENTNWEYNVASFGVTYTPTDGRFTVTNSGIYEITVSLLLTHSTTGQITVNIKKSGSTIFTSTPYIHNAVDPAERTHPIIVSATAGEYFEVTIDSTGSATLVAEDGTTFNIKKIA